MAANVEAKIVIRGDTKQAQDEVEKVNRRLGDLKAAGTKAGDSMNLLSAVLTQQVGRDMQQFGRTILGALNGFVQAGRESVRAGKDLEAVLASTKGAAGLTAKEVTGLADSLAKVTNFEDETILRGENMLLTFTKIGRDVFPLATEAMLNMSEKMGVDVQNSAIQLGKALNDPINGVTALRRVGVALTEQQEAQIKAMVEAGNVAGAQRVILQELETEFGGLARATADSGTQLMKTWGELKEEIGKVLIPAFDAAAEAIGPILEKAQAWIQQNPELAKTIGILAAAIGGLLLVGGSLIVTLGAVAAAAAAVGIALGPVSIIALAIVGITALVITLRDNWGWMAQAMKDNFGAAIDWIIERMNALLAKLQEMIDRFNVFKQIQSARELAAFEIKDYAGPKLQARAMGGPASGLTLVGEEGPELVSLPGGSYVHNNRDSQRMMGGITIGSINVNNEADEDRLIQKLTRLIQLQTRQAA